VDDHHRCRRTRGRKHLAVDTSTASASARLKDAKALLDALS
jgi:hypothetical protein